MRSFFRIYAKTSKGNDNNLVNQLKSFGLSPKYDQHLNAFYFNSNFKNLFDLSYKCMTVQQMYVQIGQKFRLIDQQQITIQLQKLPFKNYIPIQRGLVQNTTLKILIRESIQIPSQNVLINLFQNALNKQVIKRQYYQKIINNQEQQQQQDGFFQKNQQKRLIVKKQRKNGDSYYEIKDIVDKKWYQQDILLQQKNQKRVLQLQNSIKKLKNEQKKLISQNKISQPDNIDNLQNKFLNLRSEIQIKNQITTIQKQLQELSKFDKQNYISELLSYHPHMIFYIRKNRGRFLLKINRQDLYKHGFKTAVNYGPIRQSIAASVLQRSKLLKSENHSNKIVKIWDPMCGSGTIPLVASTILDNVLIRNNNQNLFLWKKWPIYKEQYFQIYLKQKQEQKIKSKLDYQLILSDKDRQTINYSIQNFRQFINKNNQLINKQQKLNQLFPSKNLNSQILQLSQNKIGFACGDFEEVIKILIPKQNKQKISLNNNYQQNDHQNLNKIQQNFNKINIITNLPYLHGRSQQKYPLNQLKSIYKRFSEMIKQNKQYIDNVFIIIDSKTTDWNHFINISSQKWTLISQYSSGGLQIGLYEWQQNRIKTQYEEETCLTTINSIQLNAQQRQLVLKKQKSIQKALIEYRKKLSQIDRKYYRLPKYLMKDKKGWQRILEKRRRRHLQSAYELFAKRRDQMIAFKQYARLKLQLKMIKRGTVWKNKNLKFFQNNNEKLVQYSSQIGDLFQNRIQQALKRQQQAALKRKIKQGDKIQIVKMRNKWNADQKKLVKQIKNSKQNSFNNKKNGSRNVKASTRRK